MTDEAMDDTSPAETIAGQAVEGVDLARAIDGLVPEDESVANAVLADNPRTTRWAGLLFGCCSVLLAPWTEVIAVTLDAGFDIMTAPSGWDQTEAAAMAILV